MEPVAWAVRPWGMDDLAKSAPQHVRVRHLEFDDFYRSSWDDVYRPLAVTLRDPDLAAEAVEEGMARAYQSWRKVRDARNQQGWVYRVALNWSISHLRKTRREIHGRTSVDGGRWVNPPDVDLFDALGQLDMKHRSVVVLRYLLDWSEQEVAAALEVPQGTVKSRLHRSLGKLREELS